MKILRILSKLNPVNSLFGRIFLWFWLTAMVLAFSAVWLSKQTASNYSVKPLNANQSQRINSVARRFESIAERRPDANLSILLGRAGQRSGLALMLYHPQNKAFIYGFPRGLGRHKEPFMSVLEEGAPFEIKTVFGVFHGPTPIEINSQIYQLFAGKPAPQGLLRRLNQHHPGWLISTALLVSTLLCALLAWSLVKPIRELQSSAQKMSLGDLQTRVKFALHRGDELGQLGKDFNSMAEDIERLLGSQKRLLADVSHELRSPLARLQVAIGIAQQQPESELNAVTHKQLQRIEKEAHQMERMIAQILRLSRMQAKVQREEKEEISLQTLLNEVISDAEFEAQNTGKTFVSETIPECDISCYPDLLAGAVRNVIGNAIKYSSTKVEVLFSRSQDNIRITVVDDGSGVPESELKEIFVPFYRLSASRDRASGGVGLGLAIAKQAIDMHNGEISVVNNDIGGLTVSIGFPI